MLAEAHDQFFSLNYLWICKKDSITKSYILKKQFETFKNDREFKPRWREERAPTITFMSSSYFMNMNSNIKGATYKNVNENIHELTRIINKMWKNTSPYVMMSVSYAIKSYVLQRYLMKLAC